VVDQLIYFCKYSYFIIQEQLVLIAGLIFVD